MNGAKREIRIIAFNRPRCAEAVVEHLARADHLAEFKVVASLDARPDGTHNRRVADALRSVTDDVRLRPRLGMRRHAKLNYREFLTETEAPALLHLEDDILLARDALRFALEYEEALVGRVRSLSLLGDGQKDVYTAQRLLGRCRIAGGLFCPYGDYMTRDGVQAIVNRWQDDWGWWAVGITGLYRALGWQRLIPLVSRARNIGYPPESPLGKKVARAIWSDMFYSNT